MKLFSEDDANSSDTPTPLALYRLEKSTVRVQDHLDAALLRERFNLQGEN